MMTPEEQKEEMKKCQESPAYFHNKYVTYPGKQEITQKEWDELMKVIYCYPLKRRGRR